MKKRSSTVDEGPHNKCGISDSAAAYVQGGHCAYRKNRLTPRSTVLPQKLTGPQLVKKFPASREPVSSLPHSQEPTTGPYPHPDQSSPGLTISLLGNSF